MNWNYRIQYYMMGILIVVGILGIVSTYRMWYVPSPFTCFVLLMLSIGLLVTHILQKQESKWKEITLVFFVGLYITLLFSSSIYNIWKWERVFTKEGITKAFLSLLLLLDIYLTFAYVRIKTSYKRVKGNQKRVNRKLSNKKKINDSEEIHLILGNLYKNSDK